jgi:hypothetical protein
MTLSAFSWRHQRTIGQELRFYRRELNGRSPTVWAYGPMGVWDRDDSAGTPARTELQELGEKHRTEDTEGTEGVEMTVSAVFLAGISERSAGSFASIDSSLLFSDSRFLKFLKLPPCNSKTPTPV